MPIFSRTREIDDFEEEANVVQKLLKPTQERVLSCGDNKEDTAAAFRIGVTIADPDGVDDYGACDATKARVQKGAFTNGAFFVSHCIWDIMMEPFGLARFILLRVRSIVGHLGPGDLTLPRCS
jgi:hypothetical protein